MAILKAVPELDSFKIISGWEVLKIDRGQIKTARGIFGIASMLSSGQKNSLKRISRFFIIPHNVKWQPIIHLSKRRHISGGSQLFSRPKVNLRNNQEWSFLFVSLYFSESGKRLMSTKVPLSCCCCSIAQSCPTFCDPWTAASQAALSLTISWSLSKFMFILHWWCHPSAAHFFCLRPFPASWLFQ